MKFFVALNCESCGAKLASLACGELTFPSEICPECGATIHIVDPVTFSIVASRLLLRGEAELNNGDFTMPIICGAMAVESALTSLFLKWKKMEHDSLDRPTTATDREAWMSEYRVGTGRGGFAKSADFVSRYVTQESFDVFVTHSQATSTLTSGSYAGVRNIQGELFDKRNLIMHWGEVNHERTDAEKALSAARTAFALLGVMDKRRAAELQRKMRESLKSKA